MLIPSIVDPNRINELKRLAEDPQAWLKAASNGLENPTQEQIDAARKAFEEAYAKAKKSGGLAGKLRMVK